MDENPYAAEIDDAAEAAAEFDRRDGRFRRLTPPGLLVWCAAIVSFSGMVAALLLPAQHTSSDVRGESFRGSRQQQDAP